MSASQNQPPEDSSKGDRPENHGAFSDPGRIVLPRPHFPADKTGPDAIHAPWRLSYLETITAEAQTQAHVPDKRPATSSSSGSFLRDYWLAPHKDRAHHVIARSTLGMILLNAYPYSTGHLLVALGEARPTLLDYTPDERAALWRLTDCAAALVQAAFEPQGINMGINQGRAAGAGVPSHLHVHLVPRWAGDVNFINVVGEIRVIPASLESTYARYAAAWERLVKDWLPVID